MSLRVMPALRATVSFTTGRITGTRWRQSSTMSAAKGSAAISFLASSPRRRTTSGFGPRKRTWIFCASPGPSTNGREKHWASGRFSFTKPLTRPMSGLIAL